MSQERSIAHLIGDHEHLFVDTKAPGYEPVLTLVRKGANLAITAAIAIEVPLHVIDDVPLDDAGPSIVGFVLERLGLDLRIDGAAEIRAYLLDNPVRAEAYDGQGHA